MLKIKKLKTIFEDDSERSEESSYQIAKTKTKPRINFEAEITKESNPDEESDESEENSSDFDSYDSEEDEESYNT